MNQECIINSLIIQWKTYATQKGVKWERSLLQWNLPLGVEADFALRLALPIAFKTKNPIKEVAQQIISLNKNNFLRGEITPQGYINFRLSDEYYYKFIKKITLKKKLEPKKSVILEHTSVNPTGQLHLGHARVAVIGDTLANIYQFLGFQTVREYYINDRGQQINSLVNSIYFSYCFLYNYCFSLAEKDLEYQSLIVKKIAQLLSQKYKNTLIKENLDPKIFGILRKEALEFLLTKIKKDLKKCRIVFDNWVSETELCKNDNLTQLVQTLSTKKLTYFQEGALFLKTTQIGDEKDRVLVKKNGDYTYFLPDILYHLNKLSRADFLINIFGADHHSHVSGVKSALKLYNNYGSIDDKIKIVLVQMLSLLSVEGKSQKFSKRLGTAINLDEALKWWGKDWLRFTLLSKSPNTHLEINEKMLRTEQKSQLYYLQYAHARCCQLLAKAREKGLNLNSKKIVSIWNTTERNILKNLLRFSFILQTIIEENEPHYLIHYLTELAQDFQTYYQGEVIIDESKSLKTKQKLLLVHGIKKILKFGLNLAGITAPRRM